MRRKMAIIGSTKKEPEHQLQHEEDVDTTTMVIADDDFITHYSNGTFKIAKRGEVKKGEMNTKLVANPSLVVDKIKDLEFVVTKIPNPEIVHEDIEVPFEASLLKSEDTIKNEAKTLTQIVHEDAIDRMHNELEKQKQKIKEEEEESRMNLQITTPPTMRLLALREIKPLAYAALRKDDSLTFAGALTKVSKELGFANYEFYVVDYCNSKSA